MAIEKVINIKVNETGLDDLNKDLGTTATAIKGVDDATNKLNKDLQGSDFKTFKTQLKEANIELQKMSSLFGETSTEAIEAAKNVAKIKDEMEFQKDLIKSYNPDEKFRALSQTAGIATLALGGVKDGLSAFGVESEKLDKIIGGAQGILGATSAIGAFSDAYGVLTARKKASAVASETLAGAELAEAGASGVATTGAGALAVAEGLVLAPITLIVAGVALLVGGFLYFKDSIYKVIAPLKEFAEFMGHAYDKVTDFIGLTSDASRAFDAIAESAKKSSELNTKFLAEEGDTLNKYTKEKIDAKQRYNEAVQKDGADQVALAKRLNRELKAVDDEHEADLKKSRDEASKKASEEAQKKADEKDRLAKEAKSKQDALDAKEKARVDSLADYDKKVNEATRSERAKTDQEKFDLMQQRAQEELNLLKATGEEKVKLQADLDILQAEQSATFKADQAEKKKKEDEQKLKDDQDYWAKQADAKKEADDKTKASEKAVVDAKKANTDQLINQGENLVKNVQALAGKNKAIQKAAIIVDSGISLGKVGISTAEAITKDLAKGFPINIPLIALDAAVGVTSALAIVKNTSSALQAVGGGSAPSASNQTSATPTAPSFNLAEGTTQGAIALANQNKQEPIKAFVVGQEITSQQQLDLKTQQTASFG